MQLSFSHEDYNLIIKLIKSVIVFNRDYTDLYNAVEFFFFSSMRSVNVRSVTTRREWLNSHCRICFSLKGVCENGDKYFAKVFRFSGQLSVGYQYLPDVVRLYAFYIHAYFQYIKMFARFSILFRCWVFFNLFKDIEIDDSSTEKDEQRDEQNKTR